jgi:RHS repeat-associated protein
VINNKGLLQNIWFNGGVGESNKLISTMTYTHKNELLSKSIGNNNVLQKLDYTYNPQGWLTSINPNLPVPSSFVQYPVTMPNGVGNGTNDLFQMTLHYNTPETAVGSSTFPQLNGNISQIKYQVLGRAQEYWNYEYDYLDRLKNASHTMKSSNGAMSIGQYSENLTYDGPRGNITSIKRFGAQTTQNAGNYTTLASGLIDDLTMSYIPGTNKLNTVTDNGQLDFKHLGFKIATGAIGSTANTYDASGNITYDHSKKANITYNYLNLPSSITFLNGGNKIDYQYSASGQKLRTIRSNGATNLEIQHYLDGIKYKQQINTSNYRLEAIYHPEGRIYNTNITNLASSTIALRHEFCIKDHLGNTRITFADKNSNGQVDLPGEILQENHYYPFGMNMNGPWMNDAAANDKPYQYNGKELESFGGLGWNDYGARFYDPSVGRFISPDPLSELAPDWTPYRYGFNNPILYTDPDGMFESKASAEEYAKQHNIKTGWFRSNKIVENSDGTYSIENKKKGTSTSDHGGDLGVMTGAMVGADDVMDKSYVYEPGLLGIPTFQGVSREFRDGSQTFQEALHVSPGLGATSSASGLVTAGSTLRKLPSLPSVDATGKLHGTLPKLKDLYKYPKSVLKEFLRDLKKSVPNRIKSTVKSKANASSQQNRSHGQRQGWEQDVIQYLEKYLNK